MNRDKSRSENRIIQWIGQIIHGLFEILRDDKKATQVAKIACLFPQWKLISTTYSEQFFFKDNQRIFFSSSVLSI